MRILTIAGENLASLDRFEVPLAQGPLAGAGLLCICGPTGAGKSTLLDALCLALYDRTPRLGGDSLAVVQKSAVTAMAQVDFRDSQGQSWRAIWRARRAHRKLAGEWQPTQLELHNLDTGADHSSHRKKETLQRIEAQVGLGFDQFCRSVLLAQGDFARFLHETGKERARLLETITGGEIYSDLSQRTFQHYKAARERLEQLAEEAAQSRVLSEQERVALREQQATAVQTRARLERQRDGYQALLTHQREIAEREREVAEATAERAAAAAALEQVAAVSATLFRWQHAERLRPLFVAADDALAAQHEAATKVATATSGRQAAAARIAATLLAERQREDERERARAAWLAAQPVLHSARAIAEERRAVAAAQAQAQAAQSAADSVLAEREQALTSHRQLAADAEAAGEQAQRYLQAHPELQLVHAKQQGLQRDLAALSQHELALGEIEQRLLTLQPALRQGEAALALAQQEGATANATRQGAQARLDGEQEALRALTTAGTVSAVQHELALLVRTRARLEEGARLLAARAEREQRAAGLKEQLAADELAVRTHQAAAQAAAGEQAQLAVTRATVEADLRIAQAAADLATRRPELLQPGRPCPLCGSTEHPVAQLPMEHLGVSLPARLQAELAACDAEAAKARLREREAAADGRAAQTRLAVGQEQGAQLLQQRAYDATQVQGLTTELARLQGELGAVQSPLAEGLLPPGRELPAALTLAERVARLGEREVTLERCLAAHTAQQAAVAIAQASCDRERLRWEQLAQRATQLQAAQLALMQQGLRLEENRATTAKLAEQARAAAAAQLGEHAPWHVLLLADPAALQRVLSAGLGEFARQLQQKDSADRALAVAAAEVRVATAAVTHASAECAARAAGREKLQQELLALTARQTQLLAALGASDPELDLERLAAALQAGSEQADAAHQAAVAARMTAEREAAVAGEALAQAQRWQAAGQATLAARQAELTTALGEAGLVDRDEARALLAVSAEERAQQRELVAARQRAAVQAESRLLDRAERLQQHRDRDLSAWLLAIADPSVAALALPALSAVAAEAGASATKSELQEVLERLYILELRLHEDEQRQVEAVQRQAERTAQAKLVEDWALLNELIGSADGAKFRAFAQSLTLETLLVYTNEHLRSLRPRYSLRRRSELAEGKPGETTGAKAELTSGLRNERLLDLEIVDHDMGAEVRDCATLSGGESFLVSLALALGLSSLSARNVRVESLFIDEGFGSLDRDTLDSALAVLEELQAHGQQIGIISHITELSDRIAHRVLVQPQRAGRSTVRVQVGDLVPGLARRHAQVA